MPSHIKFHKGLNIKLVGQAEKIIKKTPHSETFAIKPTDFYGLVPKLKIKVGDNVKAGTPLFFNKQIPQMLFVAPVSGIIKSINRGERRRILEVVIEAEKNIDYVQFKKKDYRNTNVTELKELMLESGIWPGIRQRPYGIIANPDDTPKSIFISAFDTAPLAPDIGFLLERYEQEFQIGLNVLSKLTSGNVYLNLKSKSFYSKGICNAQNVKVCYFSGPHPAGNVGVQIHRLDPICKGQVVWTVHPFDVVIIGRLFLKGIYDARKIIAITGSEVIKPAYYQSIIGENFSTVLKGNLKDDNKVRVISGNPLTGTDVGEKGYLGYYDTQISVIPEGDNYEFFGWLKPGFNKFSMSRTFPTWLLPFKKYKLTANLNGEERAFVMSGQYERVFPMDILPVYLLKAILTEDIDKMEQLGIYEVVPEDFALCEFICTSKIKVQDIVRKGIDTMIKELG